MIRNAITMMINNPISIKSLTPLESPLAAAVAVPSPEAAGTEGAAVFASSDLT
jgi:hypothetical protein